jgi:hypothetical protein
MWVIYALLDSDPGSESGSTDLIESGSETLYPVTEHKGEILAFLKILFLTIGTVPQRMLRN